MAKLYKPFYGDEATGGFANTLFFKRGVNYGIVSKKKIIITSKSPAQHAERTLFDEACNTWNALSDTEQATWRAAASKPVTGFNLFIGLYILTGSVPLLPETNSGHVSTLHLQHNAPQLFVKTINIFR